MNSNNTYFHSSLLIGALLLIAFLTGCKDSLVGIEGFCPIVESTSPTTLETNVNTNTVITVTFEEKINPNTMVPSAFILTSTTTDAATSASIADGTILFQNPINIIIPPAGALLSSNTIDAQKTSPGVRGSVPAMNPESATGRGSNDLTILNSDEDTSSPALASVVDGTMTFDNDSNTMTFTPRTPLTVNLTYTATVKNTVEDPIGNRMLEDYVWTFSIEAGASPTIVDTAPQDGDQNVALDAPISATFSQLMNPVTLNLNSYTLFNGSTQVNGSVSYNNMNALFQPNDELLPGVTYTATIKSTVENQLGTSLATDFVWSFTTDSGASPVVATTAPLNNAVNVALDANVTATFSQAMNSTTLNQNTFTLFNGSTQVNGSVSYSNMVATFNPNSDLQSGTTYTATITTGAESDLGMALEDDFVWIFTTEAQENDIPTVTLTDPLNEDENVALNTSVSATFSLMMDAGSLNQNTFTLFDGANQINGSVSYNNQTATFEPNSDLAPETTYTATITTGAESDLGMALEDDFVWIFTTEAQENDIPTVTLTDPLNEDENVALNTSVSATFSLMMDAGSLNQNTFTLFDGANQINGSVSYNNQIATFNPNSDLAPETTYTATITTGAESDLGMALEDDFVWIFTTEAQENDIPTVTLTDPLNEDENVALNTSVSATFSLMMDAGSLNQNTFTLFDGANQINGSVSYNNQTATFEPNSDLAPETTYTATITTGAESDLGMALEDDFVWIFTTELAEQEPPIIGSAETYGIMATAAITNTGNTVINGDVSLDPGTSLTGFPPGEINGVLNVNNTESAQARADLLVGYNYFKALPPGTNISAGADLGALYPNGIAPGTYTSGSTMLVSSPLVLDAGGDENAMWVFQIGSSLTTGADITLTGGANVNNIFWVPTEDATIGVGTIFHGTIVSGRDVTAITGAVINGRILAGAITAGTIALDNNTVNVPGFQKSTGK